MAAIDKASKLLDDMLEPGEELLGAVQALSLGTMKSATGISALSGGLGLLGSLALQRIGDKDAASDPDVDPALQIDFLPYTAGLIAFSDRRLFLTPASARKSELRRAWPLDDVSAHYEDRGKLSTAVRTYIITVSDGEWFVCEVQHGLWKKKSAEDFSENLARALS